MRNKHVIAGEVIKPHGIKGEVCIESYMDFPSHFLDKVFLQKGRAPLVEAVIESARPHQGRLLAVIKGVTSRNMAEDLRGAKIVIEREVLPEPEEGEFYIEDLLGLLVFLENDELLGVLENVDLSSGQEVWAIVPKGGKEILFPAVPEFVKSIDLSAGKIVITPPEGLIELYR